MINGKIMLVFGLLVFILSQMFWPDTAEVEESKLVIQLQNLKTEAESFDGSSAETPWQWSHYRQELVERNMATETEWSSTNKQLAEAHLTYCVQAMTGHVSDKPMLTWAASLEHGNAYAIASAVKAVETTGGSVEEAVRSANLTDNEASLGMALTTDYASWHTEHAEAYRVLHAALASNQLYDLVSRSASSVIMVTEGKEVFPGK